ncbi:phage GP46 family protein [Brachyspira pulli]|uniref:phage GP46 family protein n=1 Tax=Brachyspira pulli TaxID=310721 RepID=UPI0030040C14
MEPIIEMLEIDLNKYNNIEYLVSMSIYSNKNKWWADNDFGSDLFAKKDKLSKETQNEVKRIITDSLEWIVEDGLAKDIEVDTEIENKSRLNYSVLVIKPDNNTEIIKGVWNNE